MGLKYFAAGFGLWETMGCGKGVGAEWDAAPARATVR
jgi:hypothetical protein